MEWAALLFAVHSPVLYPQCPYKGGSMVKAGKEEAGICAPRGVL